MTTPRTNYTLPRGLHNLHSRSWTQCDCCAMPVHPSVTRCRVCAAWITTGRPPRPPAPTPFQLERMLARVARRVAALESDADYGGSRWAEEFHQLFERVGMLEGRR